jgi:hypothetical protein
MTIKNIGKRKASENLSTCHLLSVESGVKSAVDLFQQAQEIDREI